MRVMYIGRQPRHKDRLFGTGTRWTGPGDIQEVDDGAAEKMVNQHPTVYAFPAAAENPDTLLDMGSRDAIAEYAAKHFGVTMDKRRARDVLAKELQALMETN